MARELYEMGCEIPMSELDVGDIIFIADENPLDDDKMFNFSAWRNITHVAMIYEIDKNGQYTIIDCTDWSEAIYKTNISWSTENYALSKMRAFKMLENTVMCARMPIAFGIEPNVPNAITKLETPQ
jgi:hypothetical protein